MNWASASSIPIRRLQGALPSHPWRVCAAALVIALVYAWFWLVTAHRVHDPPQGSAASVFITGCGDFEHFFNAARALRDGQDLVSAGAQGYIYPPLIAFAFMPLTQLSVQSAATLMLLVNLALALGCTVLASNQAARRLGVELSLERRSVLVAVTTLLSATRLRSELQMWQTDLLLLAALLLALAWLDARPWLAGLVLGMAFNIKYLPLVFLPYLLLRRRFSAAAGFGAGGVVFALVPALQSGWRANLDHWAAAAAGLARLLGFAPTAAQVAHVDPITAGYSVSITSGIARVLGPAAAPWLPWLASGAIALLVGLALRRLYAVSGHRLMRWPPAREQVLPPYRGVVLLEWAALLTLALAFGPQTNPRHMSLLVLALAPLATLAFFTGASAARRPALVGLIVLLVGLALPPTAPAWAAQTAWWLKLGGAGWAMVVMLPFLFIAGFAQLAAARAHRPAAGSA